MGTIGVMVCGHGSRDLAAVAEFRQLVAGLVARLPQYAVESGFLEFARPILRDGLDRLRARGVERVLAVPGMLFAAGHVKNDVPSVLNAYAAEHGLRIDMGRELGLDPKLLAAARDRIDAALAGSDRRVARADTLLAVIGRGTSDPDANGNVCKLARMLWEGMGLGWAETGYSGVALPRVEALLERAIRLGFRRIVVFPYFLFTGVLVRRIYREADAVAARHPEVLLLKAGYLGDHPLVTESFIERIEGIRTGDVNMNCLLCKYRSRVIGHEAAAGAPQQAHHHHVEGIGSGAPEHAHPHHDHHHHHHHRERDGAHPHRERDGDLPGHEHEHREHELRNRAHEHRDGEDGHRGREDGHRGREDEHRDGEDGHRGQEDERHGREHELPGHEDEHCGREDGGRGRLQEQRDGEHEQRRGGHAGRDQDRWAAAGARAATRRAR